MGTTEASGTIGPNQSVTWTIGEENRFDGWFDHDNKVVFNAHQFERPDSVITPLGNTMSVSNIRTKIYPNHKYSYIITVTNNGGWTVPYHVLVSWW
jgi:hypothetical protein